MLGRHSFYTIADMKRNLCGVAKEFVINKQYSWYTGCHRQKAVFGRTLLITWKNTHDFLEYSSSWKN